MYNYHWLDMVAYEKIVEAHRWAEHGRRVLAAEGGKCGAPQAAGSPVAGLFRSLASAFRRGRPSVDSIIMSGHTR